VKADSLTARDLFGKPVRYVIPTFQRPYVWKQDEQWEPFWEDVQYAAERFLEELAGAPPDDPSQAAQALERCGRHFLGAIVVKQQLTATSQVDHREVIDGQQRLTTLQLLLDAARTVAEAEEWDDLAFQLQELTANAPHYAKKDPDLVFKLWPTTTDQEAFRAVMGQGASGASNSSRLAHAHDYFQLRVRDWVYAGEPVEEPLRRAAALGTALIGLMELVVIDLGASDDAFTIFETLNARGTPLLASDLVKNYLLQIASSADGVPTDEMSERYWSQFDDDWWRREIRQGRLRRPRIDTFLDYWLEARTGDEVASHEVFPTFKKLIDDRDGPVSTVANGMTEMAGVYRQLDELDRYTRDGTFLYRWEQLDTRVVTPLLLWVFRWAPDQLPPERRSRLLVAVESYLVRRMLLRLTTKQYNRTFLEVLTTCINAGPTVADEALIEYLVGAAGDSTRWPTDEDLHYAFRELPVYRLLTRGRLRTVLEALEDDHRGARSEDQHVSRGNLTIEHVLPQSWQGNWPLPETDDPTKAGLHRDRMIHSIGNLTLATSSLNSTMSNHAWGDKRKHLEDNSVLHLNKDVLQHVALGETWTESAIERRADRLYARALSIWPRP
jgi:hypothetical protein